MQQQGGYRSTDAGERAIGLLGELLRLRTDASSGYASAAERVALTMTSLGFDVERHYVPHISGTPVPSVLGWIGRRTVKPALILNAHLDTNVAGSGWGFAPFAGERKNGRVYGRGSVIAKSDVAAYIYGAATAHGAAPRSKRSILVAITCDEGAGGALGPGYILGDLKIKPALAMTAGFTDVVGVAHNGAVQGIVTVVGAASHQASMRPEFDAMEQAVRIAHAIVERNAELSRENSTVAGISSPTFNVTRFHAGESFGMAPASVELFIDRRVTPDEDLAEAEADVRATINGVSRKSGITVETTLYPGVEPLRPTDKQKRWADLVCAEARAVVGREVPAGGIPIYTDARWFAQAGIPTVLFGAGESDLIAAGINGTDENVAEEDMFRTVDIVTRVVRRVLEGQL